MTIPRLLLTLAIVFAPATAWGQRFDGWDLQPQQQKRISRKGTEMFRWLLDRGGLKPMSEGEQFTAINNPRSLHDTVVVVIGPWDGHTGSQRETPGGRWVSDWMTAAVKNGGAVLVAYDSAASVQLGGTLPWVQISGRRVVTPQPFGGEEWLVLDGDQQALFGVPIPPPAGRTGPEWNLFRGDRPLTRVVAEYPGSLTGLKNTKITPLAGFPPNSVFNTGGRVADSDDCLVAGTAMVHPSGTKPFRFLVVADHAVFMNAQLAGPTDNLEFSHRAVTFLTEGDGDAKRTKCLLVVDGAVVRDYDELNRMLRPPLPPLPKPDWEKLQPKLVDLGNHMIDKVQENDLLNRFVVGKNPDEPRSQLRTLLGLLLTAACLWAVFALVRRVWGAREPTDLNAAPPGGRPPPPPDGAAGVFGRRGKELATRDNLLEPARAACRDFFDTVGRPPEPGPRLPKVVISDVVKKPDTLRQALRDIWAVAYGRPAPVTATRWAALEPLLARALAAHRDKKWRFVEAEAWPDVSTRSRGEA